MAGIPESLSVEPRWAYYNKALRLIVDHPEAVLERSFYLENGQLMVEHDYFTLAKKFQGGGHASRMLRASYSAYDRLGVVEVRVHANLDKGGYVWARNGFRADDPEEMRAAFRRAAAAFPGNMQRQALLKVLESSSDLDLMYNVSMVADAGGAFGKQLLLGSDWFGAARLTDPAHRALLQKALER